MEEEEEDEEDEEESATGMWPKARPRWEGYGGFIKHGRLDKWRNKDNDGAVAIRRVLPDGKPRGGCPMTTAAKCGAGLRVGAEGQGPRVEVGGQGVRPSGMDAMMEFPTGILLSVSVENAVFTVEGTGGRGAL